MFGKKNISINVKLLPLEFRLLLYCVQDTYRLSEVVNRKDYLNINWESFMSLVDHHRVYPLVYDALKEYPEDIIPSYIINKLKEKKYKNTLKMLQLAAELSKIQFKFLENNVRLIVLKGPELAFELYGDISLRTSKDLDILISEEDILKAEDILLKLGFSAESSSQNDFRWSNKDHHRSYFNPIKNIQVELHWKMNPEWVEEPSFNELWERSKLSKNKIYILNNEDLFIYLASHGARHCWFRLRWLVDINYLLKRELDWKKIHTISQQFKYDKIIGQTIILVKQLLMFSSNNIPIKKHRSSQHLANLSLYFIKNQVSLNTLNAILKYKYYLYELRTSNQKLKFMLNLFIPTSSDLMSLRLPKQLYFLYFLLRPILWFLRRTKRVSF